MRIGVIGAGHAGVEAARRASELGAQVVLFSSESVLPYFRPKVVALAFGQVDLHGIYLRPEPWYREQGIDLRLNCEVIHLEARSKAVTAGGSEERFDALIIATGAAPSPLAVGQELPDDVIALWGVRESLTIRDRLARTRDLLVLGGGISGVESALYARDAGLDVTVVEKMGRVIPQQLGWSAAGVLTHRLRRAGVNVVTGRHAVTVSKQGDRLHVALDDGRELICDLVLTTVGATRKLTLFEQAGLKTDRGVVVDEQLQTSVPGIFACGDIAQRGNTPTTTVIRAHAQGRGAGENALAFTQGRELASIPEPISPLLFRHKDVEVQSVGPAAGDGLAEKVLTNDGETVYRSVLLDNGKLCGVQMIGSRDGFRQLLDSLNQPWQEAASQILASPANNKMGNLT